MSALGIRVGGHVGAHQVTEDPEDLAGFGVTAGLVLGVDELAVDDDVEDAVVAGYEAQVLDDVLVVGQQVAGRAHGAS